MDPRLESFGLRIQFKSFWPRIHSHWKSRIEFWLGLKISDWHGLIFNRFTSNKIEHFFRIGLGPILELIEMNLISSDWNLIWTNPIYSEVCTRANSKKVFNLVWLKLVENLYELIRINPDQSFNPNESAIGIIRIENSV